MLLKLLYNLFPDQFHKLVFESQRKPVNFDLLELAFVDSNGKRYYRYRSDFDTPILRKGYFEKCFAEFQAGINATELKQITDTMKLALNKKDKRGNMSPDIGMIGHLINEIENRQNNLIHPDILMDLAACLYIREDENPAEVDAEIHRKKVEQFTLDSRGGLRDFFYSTGLTKYLPFLGELGESLEVDVIMKAGKARVTALTEQMKKYSTESG